MLRYFPSSSYGIYFIEITEKSRIPIDKRGDTMASKNNKANPGSRFSGLTLLKKSSTVPAPAPEDSPLETFENLYQDRDYEIHFDCPEFTSLCPVTGQPDFGAISIRYIPDAKCVESKSLKLHLFSYRNHQTFHEEAVNSILDAVVAACRPRRAEVTGNFRPRGGIAINVKAEYISASTKKVKGK